MRDVAQRAGVSVNTVSLALRNTGKVRPHTRARIMKAVQELGYTPNHAAQHLRRGVSKTIGMMIPDVHNFHYWDVIDGAEDEAHKHGYSVVIANTHLDEVRESETMRGLLASRYDGIILATTYIEEPPDNMQQFMNGSGAVVTLGRTWKDSDRIIYFSEEVGRILLEHLYELGHRRIGFVVGVSREGLAIERLNAYRAFVAEHGLPSLIAPCGPTIPDSIEATRQLLDSDPRPTAIMSVNDYLALGIYRAIMERGLRIPEDVSVAGFDNTAVGEYLCPALTTVDVGGREVGRTAVRMLLERIADRAMPSRIVEMEARLVPRDSTAPPI